MNSERKGDSDYSASPIPNSDTPRAIDPSKHIAHRISSINFLENALRKRSRAQFDNGSRSAASDNEGDFTLAKQIDCVINGLPRDLPRHLRRRTTSHIRYRMSTVRRLAPNPLLALLADELRPRKHRRKPSLLRKKWASDTLQLIQCLFDASVSQSSERELSESLNKFPANKIRLPTHMWHARRFAMESHSHPFNIVLPLARYDINSSQCLRWLYSSPGGSVIYDNSSLVWVSLSNVSLLPLIQVLQLVTSPGVVTPELWKDRLPIDIEKVKKSDSLVSDQMSNLANPCLWATEGSYFGLSRAKKNRIRRALLKQAYVSDANSTRPDKSTGSPTAFSSSNSSSSLTPNPLVIQTTLFGADSYPQHPIAPVSLLPFITLVNNDSANDSKIDKFAWSYHCNIGIPISKLFPACKALQNAIDIIESSFQNTFLEKSSNETESVSKGASPTNFSLWRQLHRVCSFTLRGKNPVQALMGNWNKSNRRAILFGRGKSTFLDSARFHTGSTSPSSRRPQPPVQLDSGLYVMYVASESSATSPPSLSSTNFPDYENLPPTPPASSSSSTSAPLPSALEQILLLNTLDANPPSPYSSFPGAIPSLHPGPACSAFQFALDAFHTCSDRFASLSPTDWAVSALCSPGSSSFSTRQAPKESIRQYVASAFLPGVEDVLSLSDPDRDSANLLPGSEVGANSGPVGTGFSATASTASESFPLLLLVNNPNQFPAATATTASNRASSQTTTTSIASNQAGVKDTDVSPTITPSPSSPSSASSSISQSPSETESYEITILSPSEFVARIVWNTLVDVAQVAGKKEWHDIQTSALNPFFPEDYPDMQESHLPLESTSIPEDVENEAEVENATGSATIVSVNQDTCDTSTEHNIANEVGVDGITTGGMSSSKLQSSYKKRRLGPLPPAIPPTTWNLLWNMTPSSTASVVPSLGLGESHTAPLEGIPGDVDSLVSTASLNELSAPSAQTTTQTPQTTAAPLVIREMALTLSLLNMALDETTSERTKTARLPANTPPKPVPAPPFSLHFSAPDSNPFEHPTLLPVALYCPGKGTLKPSMVISAPTPMDILLWNQSTSSKKLLSTPSSASTNASATENNTIHPNTSPSASIPSHTNAAQRIAALFQDKTKAWYRGSRVLEESTASNAAATPPGTVSLRPIGYVTSALTLPPGYARKTGNGCGVGIGFIQAEAISSLVKQQSGLQSSLASATLPNTTNTAPVTDTGASTFEAASGAESDREEWGSNPVSGWSALRRHLPTLFSARLQRHSSAPASGTSVVAAPSFSNKEGTFLAMATNAQGYSRPVILSLLPP